MENKEQSRKWMDREDVRLGAGLERELGFSYDLKSVCVSEESEGGELAYANWN